VAQIGPLKLTGASGRVYQFTVYSADTVWKDGVACVYYISKRTQKPEGGGSHAAIYVGETQDLKNRHLDHHKQQCFERHGYNCISLFIENSSERRLLIEKDLVEAVKPPCND
jgi:hypothetical protein